MAETTQYISFQDQDTDIGGRIDMAYFNRQMSAVVTPMKKKPTTAPSRRAFPINEENPYFFPKQYQFDQHEVRMEGCCNQPGQVVDLGVQNPVETAPMLRMNVKQNRQPSARVIGLYDSENQKKNLDT
jgi:hypothetical protein